MRGISASNTNTANARRKLPVTSQAKTAPSTITARLATKSFFGSMKRKNSLA